VACVVDSALALGRCWSVQARDGGDEAASIQMETTPTYDSILRTIASTVCH
jgi:hypothetical protein